MLETIFTFGKTILQRGMQWLNQKRQAWTRPTKGSATLEVVSDLLRPKSALVLENALQRQRLSCNIHGHEKDTRSRAQ